MIYTSDGKEIGRVKEVRDDFLKVDAPLAPDYWLREDCIGSRVGDVRLRVPEHLLNDYMLDEPDSLIRDNANSDQSSGAGMADTPWNDDVANGYRREWI